MISESELATLSLSAISGEKTPVYQRLAVQIRQMIKVGRLAPGERLPSSRMLAQLLGISRTTTLNTYDQLIAEGLLISRPGSGVYVTALDRVSFETGTEEVINHPEKRERLSTPDSSGIFDAGPDVERFPSALWSRSLGRVWRHPDPTLLRDNQPGGYGPLRQAVVRYIRTLRDISCRPEQVIITAGHRDALSLIAQALLDPGAGVALEDPCYLPLKYGLSSRGADLAFCQVDSEGMTLPGASAPVNLAWMTPARQFPLGFTMSTERRLEWLQLSRDTQCWLVEDDYDSEFNYRKVPLAPLFNLDNQVHSTGERRVIYVGSFSKIMFRTLRIGFMVVPESLIDPICRAQESLGSLASVPIQPALADFLGQRGFSSHLRRMQHCYRQRRDTLYDLLCEKTGAYFSCEKPDRGMHLLAMLKPDLGLTDVELDERLEKRGIYAPALSKHYNGEGEQGLLLGFSGTPEAGLEYGVKQLHQIVQGH